MWTASQRAVVLVITLGILTYLTFRLTTDRARISDPQPLDGSRADELATRLDPNTATQAEIAAIPSIGDKLAAAIVDYRDRYVAAHPGKLAFTTPQDLQHVRGVGPAKMETLGEHMEFPGAKP